MFRSFPSVSTSAGSGPTSLLAPATHNPTLPLATTTATTWCHSSPSTETETTSSPTRLWDMSMPTCWTQVSTEQDFSIIPLRFFSSIVNPSDWRLCPSVTGQRFVQEFLTPYLQTAQEIWQWLLASGLLGAVLASIVAVVVVAVRRKWKRSQRRKRASSYGERQPLLQSSSEEGSSSYQTTL